MCRNIESLEWHSNHDAKEYKKKWFGNLTRLVFFGWANLGKNFWVAEFGGMIVNKPIGSVIYFMILMVIDRVETNILLGKNILSLAVSYKFVRKLTWLLLKVIVLVISECDCQLQVPFELAIATAWCAFDSAGSMTRVTTLVMSRID